MLERKDFQHLYDREPLFCKIRSHLCHQGSEVNWEELKQRHDEILDSVRRNENNLPMPDHLYVYFGIKRARDVIANLNLVQFSITFQRRLQATPNDDGILFREGSSDRRSNNVSEKYAGRSVGIPSNSSIACSVYDKSILYIYFLERKFVNDPIIVRVEVDIKMCDIFKTDLYILFSSLLISFRTNNN